MKMWTILLTMACLNAFGATPPAADPNSTSCKVRLRTDIEYRDDSDVPLLIEPILKAKNYRIVKEDPYPSRRYQAPATPQETPNYILSTILSADRFREQITLAVSLSTLQESYYGRGNLFERKVEGWASCDEWSGWAAQFRDLRTGQIWRLPWMLAQGVYTWSNRCDDHGSNRTEFISARAKELLVQFVSEMPTCEDLKPK